MQKNFNLSIGQLSEESQLELALEVAELVARGIFLLGIDSSSFMMESGLGIIYFSITIFPIRAVFLATSRKRIE